MDALLYGSIGVVAAVPFSAYILYRIKERLTWFQYGNNNLSKLRSLPR